MPKLTLRPRPAAGHTTSNGAHPKAQGRTASGRTASGSAASGSAASGSAASGSAASGRRAPGAKPQGKVHGKAHVGLPQGNKTHGGKPHPKSPWAHANEHGPKHNFFRKEVAADGKVKNVSSTQEERRAERASERAPARSLEAAEGKVIALSPKSHSKMVKNSAGLAAGARSRAAAALIVDAVSDGVSLSEAFPRHLQGFDERDVSFIKEMVYGTLRQRRLLLNTLKPLFNYKITERHRIVQALLLVALYQLTFMRVPVHAVVAATVSACADIERKGFTSLVNAILRRFLREGGQLLHSDNEAVDYSFPDWLYTKLKESYPERCRDILQHSNEKAPLFLRVEQSKTTREAQLAELAAAGINAQACALYSGAIELESALNVEHIPGFAQGRCTVQDLSAQLAAPLMDLESLPAGSRVLDCCCAPGGKSAHILDLNPEVSLTALDVDHNRLKSTQDTLTRLGRTNVTLQALDATKLAEIEGTFERILVDAPCSGTGVIRRHPDIKWLRRAKDITALAQVQAAILDAAYDKLSPGGLLVYTTCSILPEENDAQVQAFLARHPEASLKAFTLGTQSYTTLQRLPGDDHGDGFFYARFVKPV